MLVESALETEMEQINEIVKVHLGDECNEKEMIRKIAKYRN